MRLEAKHWALIAGFLAATAAMLAGLDHWADAMKPAVIGGLLGQLAALIGSIFTGAPSSGFTPMNHPARRRQDADVQDTPVAEQKDGDGGGVW